MRKSKVERSLRLHIAVVLRDKRIKCGHTLQSISQLAGVSIGSVQAAEKSGVGSVEVLERLANACGLRLSELIRNAELRRSCQ